MASQPLPQNQSPETAQPRVRNFTRLDYLPVWQAMQRYTDERDANSPDQVWMLEHPPVFTQGQAGRAEHVLAPGDIPVIQVDRGGQVTYHGPGQLVVYPLLDLERLGLGVRDLVTRLEQALIDLMADYGLETARLENAPGVYLGAAKIASLGLRVRHGRCFHGLALNVDMDLEPFHRINPCGMAGMAVTSMAEHVRLDSGNHLAEVKQALLGHLWRQLCYNGRPPSLPTASAIAP